MQIDFHGVVIPLEYVLSGVVWSRYEAEEVIQASSLFDAGDRVVVAGAGMGWLAAVVAGVAGPTNVLCVEPIEHLARLVTQNVMVDSVPVRCLWGALTPDGLPVGLAYNQENWALTTTNRDGRLKVPGRTLAGFFGQGYDCLALDVEGAEDGLLDSASIAGLRKLLLEVHVFAIGEKKTEALRARLSAGGLTQTDTCVRKTANGRVEIDSWSRG